MRYFFDCTVLKLWEGHFTGIQRVIYSLAQGFSKSNLLVVVPIITGENGTALKFDVDTLSPCDEIILRRGDVVVSASPNWDMPENEENLKYYNDAGIVIVSVLYDLIPWKLPHSYGPGFPEIYIQWLYRMLHMSDSVLSISKNSLKDLEGFCDQYGINIPKSDVFRLGDDLSEFSNQTTEIVEYNNFNDKYGDKFILSVGTIEYRKNHILLLNAYRYLLNTSKVEPYKLYIVGKEGWLNSDVKYQIANDPLLSNRVEILEGISDDELHFLYSTCQFTVYPSIYEGWGLPVAESLRYGKPCIASNASSIVEIAPDFVSHINPFDCKGWSDKLCELHTENTLRDISNHISCDYVPYSWVSSARQVEGFLAKEYRQ